MTRQRKRIVGLLGFVLFAVVCAAILMMQKASFLVPTLDLKGTILSENALLGAVTGTSGGVDLIRYDAQEAQTGLIVEKDIHNMFVCASSGTLLSSPFAGDTTTRFWAYEYSGREGANKRAGRTGRALFDGEFFVSQGEKNVRPGAYDNLSTLASVDAGKTYYVMAAADLTFRCDGGFGRVPVCGNGYFEANEGCDDGNAQNGDGCTTTCAVESAFTQSPRPADELRRQYAVLLTVEAQSGILLTPPSTPTYDDVAIGAWYYGYFEEAATNGWYTGENSCAGTHPCMALPAALPTRGDIADLLVRSLALTGTGSSPAFSDINGHAKEISLQTAADHCVLDATVQALPDRRMSVVAFHLSLTRAMADLRYGTHCDTNGTPTSYLAPLAPTSSGSSASGLGTFTYNPDTNELAYVLSYRDLASPLSGAYIHANDGSVLYTFPTGGGWTETHVGSLTISPEHEPDLLNGEWYVSVQTPQVPSGEIVGDLSLSPTIPMDDPFSSSSSSSVNSALSSEGTTSSGATSSEEVSSSTSLSSAGGPQSSSDASTSSDASSQSASGGSSSADTSSSSQESSLSDGGSSSLASASSDVSAESSSVVASSDSSDSGGASSVAGASSESASSVVSSVIVASSEASSDAGQSSFVSSDTSSEPAASSVVSSDSSAASDSSASVVSSVSSAPSGPVCGNGVLEAGEECDDGNTMDGDGCFSNCLSMIPPGM